MRSVVSAENYNRTGFYIQAKKNPFKEAGSPAGRSGESSKRVNLANLKDDEILFKSLNYAERKSKSSMSGKLQDTVLSTSALLMPLVYGAMKKGSVVRNEAGQIIKNNVLSNKVGSIVPAVLVFMGAGFLIDKYNGFLERAENASPKIARKRDNNPAKAAAVDTLAKAAMLGVAALALLKGKDIFKKNFEPASKTVSKSLNIAAEKLDATNLAKGLAGVSEKFSAFAAKHPFASKIFGNKQVQTFAPALSWLGLSGALEYKVLKDRNEIANKGANSLFMAREIAKEA